MKVNEFPKLAASDKKLNPRTLNAYRHGLTGQIVLFTPDDEAAYKRHCAGVHESLAPVGYMETDLVQTIADDRWRLKRGSAIESTLFAVGISQPDIVETNHEQVSVAAAQSETWLQHEKQMLNITLYEQRIQRQIERNIKLLREYQAERKAARKDLVDATVALMRNADKEGDVFDPETALPAEFIPAQYCFSRDEIVRRADYWHLHKDPYVMRIAA